MNKEKAGIFAHLKRFLFIGAIIVGVLLLAGEGGGFLRIFGAFACFLFAWGCWENWASVRELEQEQEENGDKW